MSLNVIVFHWDERVVGGYSLKQIVPRDMIPFATDAFWFQFYRKLSTN